MEWTKWLPGLWITVLAHSLQDSDKFRGMENRLIETLLANYSRLGRPTTDVYRAIEVSIAFYLTQLMNLGIQENIHVKRFDSQSVVGFMGYKSFHVDIFLYPVNRQDEKNQMLTTFGWLKTHWNDEYLRWNASDFGGLTQIVLPPTLVWLPDFGVENSAKSIYNELFFKRFRVAVKTDGEVNWEPGGKFITSCQLDITYYPFDDQVCNLDFVDWAYHGLQVKLTNATDYIGLNAFKESGEWTVIRTTAFSENKYYDSEPDVPYPRVRFSIYLRRKPLFYTINIIAPCVTMSLLALLVFYLPPDSGEKVSLGITVLLSFSVFLLLVAENVPKTSEVVPLLGIYLTLIMAMTAMSILICVVVLNIHHRDPTAPVPKWLRRATFYMANLACMRGQVTTRRGQAVYQLCDFARDMVDHFHIHENHFDGFQQSFSEENGVCGGTDDFLLKTLGRKKTYLEEINKHLKHITFKLKETEEEDVIKAEWKTTATVLDRFFLLFFISVVLVASLVLLYVYPTMSQTEEK